MSPRTLPAGAGHFAAGIEVKNPGAFSPRLVRFTQRIGGPLVRLSYRPSLDGFENLPSEGPFLLVANHSAGLGIAEIFSFYTLYFARFGAGRKLAGFALPLDWHIPGMRALVEAAGAIPSSYAAARHALAAGVPILMFPGGDYETTRPIWQAHRVDFGGRKGFLRIAREAGVPVVPLGIRGSHFTAPILWRSELLATLLVAPRLIGQKRWGVSLLGLLGAVLLLALVPLPWSLFWVWLWLGSPATFLPWIPWTVRLRIGKPLPARELFPTDGEAGLDAALVRVQASVQRLVDGLRA
jgi:1-acyl-sn-glycerol-3-phosphate acyltransferase